MKQTLQVKMCGLQINANGALAIWLAFALAMLVVVLTVGGLGKI